jgi:hypothetical protein
MLKTLHAICAWLAVALGAVHVFFTAWAYDEFSLGAFWFAGAGVGIVYAGFLNVVLNRNALGDGVSRLLVHFANVVSVVLFGVAAFVIREPQVFFGLALFAFEAAAAVLLKTRRGALTGEGES